MPFSRIEIATLSFVSYFLVSTATRWIYLLVVVRISQMRVQQKEKSGDLWAGIFIGWFFLFLSSVINSLPIFIVALVAPAFVLETYNENLIFLIAALAAFIGFLFFTIFREKEFTTKTPLALLLNTGCFILTWCFVLLFRV
jgi:hypothetical protein